MTAGAAAEPAILTRQELRKQGEARKGGGSRAWWYVLGTAAVMVVGVGVAVLVTQGNSDTAATIRATPVTAAPAAAPPCPLTGAPAPAGSVPARPALGIKIGNYSGDRPSAGLNQADIVFEEPVEGGITRLVSPCSSAKGRRWWATSAPHASRTWAYSRNSPTRSSSTPAGSTR